MKEYTYQEQNNIENQKKLREVLSELPSFTLSFFRGIEPRTSSRTRLGYGYDLRIYLWIFWTRSKHWILKNTWNI